MTPGDHADACEAIRRVKARYFRGVDTADGTLVRSILHPDCVLDYRGCCTDPATGRDFLPVMNVVLRGRDAWAADGLARAGIVSAHHGHTADIEVAGDVATGVWAMTDHLFMAPGAPFARLTGHGHYHEGYVRVAGTWLLRTLHITRLRVEAA